MKSHALPWNQEQRNIIFCDFWDFYCINMEKMLNTAKTGINASKKVIHKAAEATVRFLKIELLLK